MSESNAGTVVPAINEIAAALAKAQANFEQIRRSKTVEVKTEKGRYTFSYAPMEEIIRATRKALSDQGIAITQNIITDEQGRWVETSLLHSSGQVLHTRYPIVAGRDQGPQGMASSVSYSRRYCWVLATGVVADDDDDGNISEGNDVKQSDEQAIQKALDAIAAAGTVGELKTQYDAACAQFANDKTALKRVEAAKASKLALVRKAKEPEAA